MNANADPRATAETQFVPCTTMRGGVVHTGRDICGEVYPLCRSTAQDGRGTQYRTVLGQPITCKTCLMYQERRDQSNARQEDCPMTDPIPMPDRTGITTAEALEGAAEQVARGPLSGVSEDALSYVESCFAAVFGTDTAEQAREMRQPSEYMRPGMAPWTREEREHVERVNAAMADGWADAATWTAYRGETSRGA